MTAQLHQAKAENEGLKMENKVYCQYFTLQLACVFTLNLPHPLVCFGSCSALA
jgi:hypothetical protein